MHLSSLEGQLHDKLFQSLQKQGLDDLRPSQAKAIQAGLLDGRNLLVCTPTASGKTLVAELASLQAILTGRGKAVYIVPLRSLASEKFREFREKYGAFAKVALAVGETDSPDNYLADYDLIICTAEKLDSLLRHRASWVSMLSVVVADEVHLLNDPSRGPTLEILLTLLRQVVPQAQIVALSATIGNPEELAAWLQAQLVYDEWRPVHLKKGVMLAGKIEFEE